MKRELILIIGIAFGLFLLTNVSAEIYFSQLDSVYNIGDMIQMSVNVTPDNAGPLRIVLVCDNNSFDVYRGAPTELIQLPLTSLWMNGMTGDCYFEGYYGSDVQKSTIFQISRKLDMNLYSDSFYAKPGDTITISGNVKRLNGENINGNVEIKIPTIAGENGTEETLNGVVSNGEFSVPYTIKSDSPAGNYRINVIAYESTENEKTSEAYQIIASLQVSQTAKSIDIALESQNIEPGKLVIFKPVLYDQSGKTIDGDVAIIINSSSSGRLFQNIVKSGQTAQYSVPTNLTSGYYNIEASTDTLSKIKSFFVSEKALVSFEIVNGTLVVKNIGNVPYKKWINVSINGKTFLLKPDNSGIPPGNSKQFKLTGDNSNGNSIRVNDDTTALSQDNVPLPFAKNPNVATGAAVSLTGVVNAPIVWIVILVILALVILFLFRDIFKKKSVAYPAPLKNKTNLNTGDIKVIKLDKSGKEIKNEPIERISSRALAKKQLDEKGFGDRELNTQKKQESSPAHEPYKFTRNKAPEINPQDKKETPFAPVVKTVGQRRVDTPSEAEQGLVTNGSRNRAAIIALKIKNTINKFSKENLEKSIEHVYEKKGAVYESGNSIFVIFSPIITKSFRNEIDATKDAEKIAEALREHNRKFTDRIDFGIGINSGDIINKIENKKLKFTSLGTFTIAAKKLADLSNGEILMTKEAYEKAMTEVKAEKKTVNGTEVYEVKKVADYDKNKKFINDFLRRESDSRNRSMIPRSSSPKPATGSNSSNSSPVAGLVKDSQTNPANKIFDGA